MSGNFEVHVQWHPQTLSLLKRHEVMSPFSTADQISIASDMSIHELGEKISEIFEDFFEQRYHEQCQMQVRVIATGKTPEKPLPWQDAVVQHFVSGDTVIVGAMWMTASMARQMPNPAEVRRLKEQQIENFRKTLRFGLNDRVLCYCGPRWLAGLIVGTGVDDGEDLLPYVVKTDPLPGLESKTISVPSDHNDICAQEVCFDPKHEMHLIKASAPVVPNSKRSSTRFKVGDKVVCRMHNAADGLENWLPGTIVTLWPTLPGERAWEIDGCSGEYADAVPYQVTMDVGKTIYCQADNHTLIRRAGMQPRTRVKGISKRMEVRKLDDGSKERVDHVTERSKRLLDISSDEDD